MGFEFSFELINGVKIGAEHIDSGDIDPEVDYLIVIDFLILRFTIIKFT